MSKFRSPPQPGQSGSEEQDLQQQGTEYPQQPQYPPQFPQQPQYSPFQQPMQPPPPKPKRRFFRSPLGIGCGVLAALIVLVIIIVAIASAASGGSSNTPATNPTPEGQSTQAASQQNTPATKPTTKPQATHGTPQIGGPISDFYGKFGQPTTMNGGWVLDQQQNTIVFADADASGNVTKVTLTTVADWNMATTKQHCIPFLPSDAQQFNDAGNFIDYHSSVGEVVMLLYAGSCVLTIAQP